MIDFAQVLMTHEKKCSPLMPCDHCKLGEFLRSHLKTEALEQLQRLFAAAPDIVFRTHHGECSPWRPCNACQAVALIRQNFNPKKLDELAERLEALHAPPQQVATAAADHETSDDRVARMLATPLQDAFPDLSIRTRNCLQNEGYTTLREIVRKTEKEMLTLPNFGYKSLNELKELLYAKGLHFGWLE